MPGMTGERTMNDRQLLERIVSDPRIMTGKPTIRGTRLTAEFILNLLAHGASTSEILEEYPGLTQEDIRACLLFATRNLIPSSWLGSSSW